MTADVYVLEAADRGEGGGIAVCWEGRGPFEVLTPDGGLTRHHSIPAHPLGVERIYRPDLAAERADEIDEAVHAAELKAIERGHEDGVTAARNRVLELISDVVALPEVRALFIDGIGAGELLATELRERVRMALRGDS